jgi:ArsR family transcriptional regulator
MMEAHDRIRPGEDDEALATLAKALGHPIRVAIVRYLLRQNACMMGRIAEVFPLAPSTISGHLERLKRAGILRGEIDGPRVCYCVEPRALERLRELLDGLHDT